MNDEKLAGIVKELRASKEHSDKVVCTSGIEDDCTLGHGMLCARHMPAILDALAAKDLEIERLRGALITVELKAAFERGPLMESIHHTAYGALNPTKEAGHE